MRRFTLAKILAAATRAKPPYRLGQKVLIDRVAAELGASVKTISPSLIEHHKAGTLRLVRIDLVQAFDPVKASLRRSWIGHESYPDDDRSHGWDAIDLDGFR